MQKVRVAGFGVSLDAFSAGIDQSLSDPLGKRGTEIFQWFFHTHTFCSMHRDSGGSFGDIDDEFSQRAMDNFGAFIPGRNIFGPLRGPWPDDSWKGLVGRKPALSCANLRFNALRTRASRDGRRHDFLLRHGRNQ